MKKRINHSEIESAKKSSRFLFLISFTLLLLLFVCFGFMYAMDVDILSFITVPEAQVASGNKVSKKDNVKEEEAGSSSLIELDIRDSNIQKYYQYVRITGAAVCDEGGYVDREEVLASKMTDKCKFSLASNIYQNYVQNGLDGTLYVKEAIVKEAYETLFGADSYHSQESIPCLPNTTFIHNGDYYFTNKIGNEEDSSLSSYEKIVKATRNENSLDITSVVLYYEKVQAVFCKDKNCEQVLENVKSGSEFGDEFFDLYLDHYKDKLYQYTYHFEMDDTGFYRYVGYERTNQ